MTTAQESTNGHRFFPLPCSFPDSQEVDRSKDSTNNNSSPAPIPPPATEPFPASAYHVPPEPFTPSPDPYRPGEYAQRPRPKVREPLPHRCQFMFSDGRQCTMARSDIHPSLCVYHSDREEQLFGDPGQRCEAKTLDFPELHSACRDLSTARGVNRALAQVFRMLARGRISRQEAATFAKLGQLLLQSIRAARLEAVDALLDSPAQDEDSGVILSERSERRISPQFSSQQPPPPSRFNQVAPRANATIRPGSSSRATNWSEGPLPESASADDSQNLSVSIPPSANSSMPPIPASPEPLTHRPAMSNSHRISRSAASTCNSPEISTYKNDGDQVMQNEHLQKNDGDRLVYAR